MHEKELINMPLTTILIYDPQEIDFLQNCFYAAIIPDNTRLCLSVYNMRAGEAYKADKQRPFITETRVTIRK